MLMWLFTPNDDPILVKGLKDASKPLIINVDPANKNSIELDESRDSLGRSRTPQIKEIHQFLIFPSKAGIISKLKPTLSDSEAAVSCLFNFAKQIV